MTLPQFVAWEDAMTAIERMPLPFIAAINGHCLGGGLQLALVCDYRLAAADAIIGLPAVKECLIPSMALYRLPRLIGAARARELILTGEPISAARAARVRARGPRGARRRVHPRGRGERRSASSPCPPPAWRGASACWRAPSISTFDAFRREMEAGFRRVPRLAPSTARRWTRSAPAPERTRAMTAARAAPAHLGDRQPRAARLGLARARGDPGRAPRAPPISAS